MASHHQFVRRAFMSSSSPRSKFSTASAGTPAKRPHQHSAPAAVPIGMSWVHTCATLTLLSLFFPSAFAGDGASASVTDPSFALEGVRHYNGQLWQHGSADFPCEEFTRSPLGAMLRRPHQLTKDGVTYTNLLRSQQQDHRIKCEGGVVKKIAVGVAWVTLL